MPKDRAMVFLQEGISAAKAGQILRAGRRSSAPFSSIPKTPLLGSGPRALRKHPPRPSTCSNGFFSWMPGMRLPEPQ